MKNLKYVLVVFVLMVSVVGTLGMDLSAGNMSEKDPNKELRKLKEAYITAVNNLDAKGVCALFAPDADIITPWGLRFEGSADMEEWLTRIYQNFKNSNTTFDVTITGRPARFIKPDVACSFDTIEPMKMLSSNIFVKRNGQWKIKYSRSMLSLPEDPRLEAILLTWPNQTSILPVDVQERIQSLTENHSNNVSASERKIREYGKEWVKAFNNGDVKVLADHYALDCDLIDFKGRHIKGRENIEKLYAQMLVDNPGLKIKGSYQIRFVKPDIAVTSSRWELYNPERQTTIRGLAVTIFTQQDNRWRAVFQHSMVPRPYPTDELLQTVTSSWPMLTDEERSEILSLVTQVGSGK